MTTPNTKFNGHTFDYFKRYDPRNANHLLMSAVEISPRAAGNFPEHYERTRRTFLDQGSEGACTGFASAQWFADTPYRHEFVTDTTGKTFYQWAKENDEWPGEAYDGSSLLGAMQGLTAHNIIDEYKWLTNSGDVAYAIYKRGAVVFGSNWRRGMMTPDEFDGKVSYSGEIVGGHCWKVAGFRTTNAGYEFRIDNSWGLRWGISGSAWITAADIDAIFADGGEACSPREIKGLSVAGIPR